MITIQDQQTPLQTKDVDEASRDLEGMLIKQLLESSGAFKGTSGVAGAQIHAGLFVEVLADAVAKSGGLGLAPIIAQSVRPKGDAQAGGADPGAAPDVRTTQLSGQLAGGVAASPAQSGALRVTSPYGVRKDPFDGLEKFHTGLDLAAPEGTAILAAEAGTVTQAGSRGGYGRSVEIAHNNGALSTLYGHAQKVLVKEGQHVAKGQPIAVVGQTGRATGPHLHFEVRVGEKPVDPTKALKTYGKRVDR